MMGSPASHSVGTHALTFLSGDAVASLINGCPAQRDDIGIAIPSTSTLVLAERSLPAPMRPPARPAKIAGYCGKSGEFDAALTDFAKGYGDQTEKGHVLLVKAIKAEKVAAIAEEQRRPTCRRSGPPDRDDFPRHGDGGLRLNPLPY